MSKDQNSNIIENNENDNYNDNYHIAKEILKPLDLNAALSVDKNDSSQKNNSPKKAISQKKYTLHSSFNSIIFQDEDYLQVPSTPILKRLSEFEIENRIPKQKKIELKQKPKQTPIKFNPELQTRSEDKNQDSEISINDTNENTEYIVLDLSGENSLDNIQDHSEELSN